MFESIVFACCLFVLTIVFAFGYFYIIKHELYNRNKELQSELDDVKVVNANLSRYNQVLLDKLKNKRSSKK